ATTDMASALGGAETALLVVPAQFLRGVLAMLAPSLPAAAPLLLCAKGIEAQSLLTMSELVGEILPDSPVAILSGPSFAIEVARDLPTAVTIASRDHPLTPAFTAALRPARLRPYLSPHPIGLDIGGAVNHVFAIPSPLVDRPRPRHN